MKPTGRVAEGPGSGRADRGGAFRPGLGRRGAGAELSGDRGTRVGGARVGRSREVGPLSHVSSPEVTGRLVWVLVTCRPEGPRAGPGVEVGDRGGGMGREGSGRELPPARGPRAGRPAAVRTAVLRADPAAPLWFLMQLARFQRLPDPNPNPDPDPTPDPNPDPNPD